jgi:hypothetical protein
VGHALTIIASVSSTKDKLSFEEDTLDALLDGFAAGGWKKTAAATIPGGDDPKVASATAAKPHARHARNAASASKVGVAEAQAKAAATATTPAAAPSAAPEPSPAIATPASSSGSQLAAGAPAVCAQYATAACNDPGLPPEIDRKQFCAGVYRRVNGLAQGENPARTCKALLKDLSSQHAGR